jgi:glycosyltransferase involved in cell wall biosynthesis
MKIAIVCDYYLDYVGGAQTSILEQCRALEDAGHTVVLVSSVRPRRVRVVSLRRAVEVRPSWTVPGVILPVIGAHPRVVEQLRLQFTELGIDTVHIQTEFGLAHAAIRAARAARIPVIHTVHTFYWQATGFWQAPVGPLVRWVLARLTGARITHARLAPRAVDCALRNLTLTTALEADVVVSPSAHQALDLRAAGVSARVVVIPNPVARRAVEPAAADPAAGKPPRLLWIARCEPEKRPLVFAHAVLIARTRTARAFEVDFVGAGSQLAAVRALLQGVPDIHIHGSVDHEEVLRLIDASSAVVVTSYGFDNQPMTIAEAVSRHRGVLYCDPRLQEGLSIAGYLSLGPDADALADSIVHLIENPPLLAALAAGAVISAGMFLPGLYVARLVEACEMARLVAAERDGIETTRAVPAILGTTDMYTP